MGRGSPRRDPYAAGHRAVSPAGRRRLSHPSPAEPFLLPDIRSSGFRDVHPRSSGFSDAPRVPQDPYRHRDERADVQRYGGRSRSRSPVGRRGSGLLPPHDPYYDRLTSSAAWHDGPPPPASHRLPSPPPSRGRDLSPRRLSDVPYGRLPPPAPSASDLIDDLPSFITRSSLSRRVLEALAHFFRRGNLRRGDILQSNIQMLETFPEDEAVKQVEDYAYLDKDKIKHHAAYFNGILKRVREAALPPPPPAPRGGGSRLPPPPPAPVYPPSPPRGFTSDARVSSLDLRSDRRAPAGPSSPRDLHHSHPRSPRSEPPLKARRLSRSPPPPLRDARDVPSSRLDPPVSGLPSSRGMIASIKSSRKEELLDLRASGAGAPPLVDDRGRRHESSSRDYDAGVPERVAAAEPLPPPPAVARERDREQDRLRDWERELNAREQALREREIRERELLEREREIREREAWAAREAAREAEWHRDRMELGPPPLMGFPGPRGPYGRPGPLDMPPPGDWYGPPDMYDGPRMPRGAPKMLPSGFDPDLRRGGEGRGGPRGGSRSRNTLRSVAVVSKSGSRERRDGGGSKGGQPEKEAGQGDAPSTGAPAAEDAAAAAGGATTAAPDSPGYQSEYDDAMVDGQGYAEGGEGLAGETFVEEMLRETVV